MAETSEMTIDLTLNDQVSPKLRAIQEEFGTLLEVKADPWPKVAAICSFLALVAVIVEGLIR